MHVDCSKYPELAVASFDLVLLTGADEAAAVERARGTVLGFEEQIIAEAIVKVDGEDVPIRPFIKWADWDVRTRKVVRAAFERLSSPTRKELAAFLATEADGVFNAAELGLAFTTIELQLLTGRQEQAALRGLGDDPTAWQAQEATIAASIAAVDGRPVAQPFDWSAWDVRTRTCVREAHRKLTDVSDKMLDDILGGGGPLPEAGPTEPG